MSARDLTLLGQVPVRPDKPRHKTREVAVGGLVIGGSHPIRVQSMTTSDTFECRRVPSPRSATPRRSRVRTRPRHRTQARRCRQF